MKQIFFLIVLLVTTFTLSACGDAGLDLDYSDFPENTMTSYAALEQIPNKRYIAYYYSDTCSHCAVIKQDILNFFYNFDELPFYMLNISITDDFSSLDEFGGTPTVFVMADGEVVDAYIGSIDIADFIEEYSDFDTISLEYNLFEPQHIFSYEDALNIEKDSYILYYYLRDCPHCQRTKPDFLKWAIKRDVDEIYFMDGATVSDPDNIPTELLILNSGTPILVVMTNGKFADEYYSGTEEVLEYINRIGEDPITTNNFTQ